MKTATTIAAQKYIEAHDAMERAKAALKEAEELLAKNLDRDHLDSIKVDGRTIKRTVVNRREFDIHALRELVNKAVFTKVTEPVVRAPLWDALVKMGTIDHEVESQVVKVNNHVRMSVK
jgi:hypothetical protein